MTFNDVQNEAYRNREEIERLQAEGKYLSLNRMPLSTDEHLEIIKKEVDENLAAVKDFLDGKTDRPLIVKTFDGRRWTETPRYLDYPESFERDVAGLSDCIGDLETADLAWISETKKIIEEYHDLICDIGYSPDGKIISWQYKKTGRKRYLPAG
jgi:hypothetical protein